MKKVFIFTTVALLASMVACSREIPVNGKSNACTPVFPLTFSTALEETKAQVSDLNIIWQENDAVGVWDGAEFRKFTISAGAGTKNAEFSGQAAQADSYTLVYPYDETLSFANEKVSASMPAVQTVSAVKGSPREALLCVGTGSNASQITLKNVFSLVKVNVPAGVSSIAFEGNVADKGRVVDALAGKADIDPATGLATPVDSVTTVVVNVPEEGGEVIFATLPSPLAGGFKIALRKSGENCDAVVVSKKTDHPLVRNAGLDVKSLPAAEYNKFFVRDADDFKKIATSPDIAARDVILGADIDFGGEKIAAIPAFSGSFDGQGHRLYNVKVSEAGQYSGIFAVTTGIVKNLVVGTADGKAWDGVSELSLNWTENVVSGDFAGLGVIGQACNSVSGIANFAKLSSTSSAQTQIGGVIGEFYSDNTGYSVTDCHAYNTIECNLSGKSAIGGVIGRNEGKGTNTTVVVPSSDEKYWLKVSGCTSSSTIDVKDSYSWGVAGIIGAIYKVSTLLSDVVFNGKISSTYTNDSKFRSGGMLGYINGTSSFKVRNATYAGAIDIATSYAAGCVSGGNTDLACYIENFYTTEDCSLKTGIAGNCAMILPNPKFNGGISVNGGAIAGTIQSAEKTVILDASNYADYIQTGTRISESECATIKFNGPEAPEPELKTVKDTLAFWTFSKENAINDGYLATWAPGQTALGKDYTTWSKNAGLLGYVNANGKIGVGKDTPTHGKLSYYQVDKNAFTTRGGVYMYTTGNPAFRGEWQGDYLLFEANGGAVIPDGAKVHFTCHLNPGGKTGMKYYKLEYLNASGQWVVPADLPLKEENQVFHNIALTNASCPIEFTETLTTGRADFQVRITCCSNYTVEGKAIDSPNEDAISRVTGTATNGEYPYIEVISQQPAN